MKTRETQTAVRVFDVNETLLDLRALDPHFQRAFGDAGLRPQWFAQFIHNACVTVGVTLGKPDSPQPVAAYRDRWTASHLS